MSYDLERQGIYVPLDESAAGQQSLRESVYQVRVGVSEVFSDRWYKNLFDGINRHCGSLIDEHETEEIRPDLVPQVIRAIESHRHNCPPRPGHESEFIEQLEVAANLALANGRPIIFVM
ncbi:hypothetical protein [Stratiformator vulcanicus]|uniref:Uncharacterized protein n=1 Tax=Stratiformator vulcanicus TaxID=2527980 RepID=A0A517R6H2_9PLAN|nr:hypothetical protein [Stratiformator vulcanicus]QDT39478.1 hypothetical protein Pan189_38860 [Stratiformator vulcanicus]